MGGTIMSMSRWDPWGELAALQRDVQELFGRSSGTQRASSLVPAMDAYRTEEGLVLKLELPGVAPDQVEINYDRGVLTITGERSSQDETKGDNYLRRERSVGRFSRSITLSDAVDPSKIAARFEHGVLELKVPTAPEQRPTRIPISGAGAGQGGQTVDVEGTSRQSVGEGESSGQQG
jgi:HSP20 family protein